MLRYYYYYYYYYADDMYDAIGHTRIVMAKNDYDNLT